jgi:hypothetical protein
VSDKKKKMTLKEKQAVLRAKKERRRLEKLAKEGRLVDGREIPRDAIAAERSLQAPNNSYSTKCYYRDIEFTCSDCGTEEVWKAKDQKWYYEVVKGPIYAGPKRCRARRKKHHKMKSNQRKQMDTAARARREETRDVE